MFAISYRNPSAEMSGTTMDDYLINGPQQALDVIQSITGADTVDIVGLCLGGALTAITDAYLSQAGDTRVGTLDLAEHHAGLRRAGAARGVHRRAHGRPAGEEDGQVRAPGGRLHGRHVRPDAGQRPDLQLRGVELADGPGPAGVRHPGLERRQHPDAGRHARVLPAQLLRREQARPRASWRSPGAPIDLGDVKSDTYVVCAENDHIVPWESAYASTRLLAGPAGSCCPAAGTSPGS